MGRVDLALELKSSSELPKSIFNLDTAILSFSLLPPDEAVLTFACSQLST